MLQIPGDIANSLNSFFDKILVVSLPRFTERHQEIREKLVGLSYDFFWGEDKLNLDYENLQQTGVYDEDKTKAATRHGRGMNLGEITCSLSHRKLYEAMLANGWQKVLVFEDDVLPRYDDLAQLPQALQELPRNWELVYLGYLKREEVSVGMKIKQFFYKLASSMGLMKWTPTMVANSLPVPYSKHLKKAGMHDCTHAYAITLEAAKTLLQEQTPVGYRADDLLSYTNLRGKLNAFVTQPKFFDQEWFQNPQAVSVKTD